MPKKRVLPYIILGILKQNPGFTGKSITYQFTNEIGEFWKAAHSQVYPELKKMQQDNWITSKHAKDNEKEIHYYLTSAGEEKLENWIDQPLTELPVNQDIFSLKMFFINDPNDPRIRIMVDEELALLEKQLAHLRQREVDVFPTKNKQAQNFGHYLILKRAMARLEGQIEWLKSLK